MRNQLFYGAAIVALMAPAGAYAQETTSSIRGAVTAEGAPVAGAQIIITHTPSGTVSRTASGADGAFNASGLRIGGPFSVSVEADGFENSTVTDIFLTAGQPFRIPLALRASEEIVVTASSTTAREQSNGPITTLTRVNIEGVASVSRDIRDLARRDPLASIDSSNGRALEIAGTNGRFNKFSVDGVGFSDDFGLNAGGLPTSRGPVPLDAIEQFSVKIAPFDIEEGDFQGGAINVVLRSGTNSFHGSAFYTYTDDSMTGSHSKYAESATNPTGKIKLDFDSKNYGGFLSGPIFKDKLFFAVAYEKLKQSSPFDDGPEGLGFANSIPRVTQASVDQVTNIAKSVYGYDTAGILSNSAETDEKITAKLDWNVSDSQRASLTYIRNKGGQTFTQNTSTSPTSPTFGFASNGYKLTEEVNSGVFQLNSDWSDDFSTEVRVAYRDYNRGQTPFGDTNFAQFEVCMDPVSVGATTTCTLANAANDTLATPRLFFGPDISRQANVLNTDNLSVDLKAQLQMGAHTIKGTFGYSDTEVFNLFLQRATGAYYFDSIEDFENRRASRLQLGGTPTGDINQAAASFSTQNYTFGLQDDIEVNDMFQLSLGARYDLFGDNSPVPLNPNFTDRYGFSNRSTYAGRGILQPRFGFNWQPMARAIVRGGVGLFAGGTPDVYLSNSYSNTGQLTNSIDLQRTATGFNQTSAAGLAAAMAGLTSVNGTSFDPAVLTFLQSNTASFAAAPVNAIDPDFKIPAQWRATLSTSYDADLGPLGDGWLFGIDLIYGKAHNAIQYTDLRSVPVGTAPDGRTIYGPFGGTATSNQDLLLTNTDKGRSYVGVVRFEKSWNWGLSISGSYARQDIKDVSAVTSSTAGSNYGNNAFLDPNFAAYGRSIYEVKNSIKASVDFDHAFFGDYKTRFSLFGEYRSGRPFSYTMRDPSSGRSAVFGVNGTGTRYLLYVPNVNAGMNGDPNVAYDSQATFDALATFIKEGQLNKYQGKIAPKNLGTSPDIFKIDLHIDQEIPTFVGKSRVKIFADIENVLNMLDRDWGAQRQVNFPYFASTVNVACQAAGGNACAKYVYSSFAEPTLSLQNQGRQSLYAIRIGAKFEF